MLSLPIEPIICVTWIRERIVAAEVITGFSVLKKREKEIVKVNLELFQARKEFLLGKKLFSLKISNLFAEKKAFYDLFINSSVSFFKLK